MTSHVVFCSLLFHIVLTTTHFCASILLACVQSPTPLKRNQSLVCANLHQNQRNHSSPSQNSKQLYETNIWNTRKCMQMNLDWLWFYFWQQKKVARIFLATHVVTQNRTWTINKIDNLLMTINNNRWQSISINRSILIIDEQSITKIFVTKIFVIIDCHQLWILINNRWESIN